MVSMGKQFENHIIIIGWNSFARLITENLLSARRKVYIISNSKDDVGAINERYDSSDLRAVFTDYQNFDSLKDTNIEKSSVVLINLEKDTDKLVYIINLRKLFKDLNIVCPIENQNLKGTFLSAGVAYPLAKEQIAAKMVASYLFEHDVATYCDDILATATSDDDYDIQQYMMTGSNPFITASYDNVFIKMKKRYNAILLGITKIFDGEKVLLKNPGGDIYVEEGDYLIVLVNGKSAKSISADFGVREGLVR
jgi:voltage-gated potassium channel